MMGWRSPLSECPNTSNASHRDRLKPTSDRTPARLPSRFRCCLGRSADALQPESSWPDACRVAEQYLSDRLCTFACNRNAQALHRVAARLHRREARFRCRGLRAPSHGRRSPASCGVREAWRYQLTSPPPRAKGRRRSAPVLFGVKEFEFATHTGFSCFQCHVRGEA